MISGYLQGEAIAGVLREAGQKRRSGLLRVCAHGEEFQLFFLNGKIVRAQVGESEASGVLERLCLSHHLFATDIASFQGETLSDAYRAFVDTGRVSAHEFLRAKIAEDYDLLHTVASLREGEYEFSSFVPVVDPRLALSLSPSQLLIESIQYHEEREQLRKAFAERDPSAVHVTISPPLPDHLSEAEERVIECIRAVSRLSEVMARTLLPGRDITHALLELSRKGVLREAPNDNVKPHAHDPSASSSEQVAFLQGVHKHSPRSAEYGVGSGNRGSIEYRYECPDTESKSASSGGHGVDTPKAEEEGQGGMSTLARVLWKQKGLCDEGINTPAITAAFLLGVFLWGGVWIRELSDALHRFTSEPVSDVVE